MGFERKLDELIDRVAKVAHILVRYKEALESIQQIGHHNECPIGMGTEDICRCHVGIAEQALRTEDDGTDHV